MKKVLFLIIVIIAVPLLAQNKKEFKISEKVKSALINLYPDAKNINWEKDENNTEASFIISGKNISVTFDSNEFYAAKTQIQLSEIPKAVKQSLDEYYHGYKIISVGIITDKLNNIFYGTELKKTTVLIKVIFDKNGKLVRNDKLPR
jgi:uncharacterized protein (UPF0333 family)